MKLFMYRGITSVMIFASTHTDAIKQLKDLGITTSIKHLKQLKFNGVVVSNSTVIHDGR